MSEPSTLAVSGLNKITLDRRNMLNNTPKLIFKFLYCFWRYKKIIYLLLWYVNILQNRNHSSWKVENLLVPTSFWPVKSIFCVFEPIWSLWKNLGFFPFQSNILDYGYVMLKTMDKLTFFQWFSYRSNQIFASCLQSKHYPYAYPVILTSKD